jgi:fructoselysine 6-kinase
MTRILGVGDNTVDTYCHRRTKFPGGNAVNVAVLAHRYGAEAAYLGYVGKDESGALILNSLRQEGLDVSRCKELEGIPTAYSEVSVVDGDRVFGKSYAGATQHIRTFDLVHTSIYSFLDEQLAELKAASRLLSFDLSERSDQKYLQAVLPHCDITFLSLSDITNDERDRLMRKMISLGPKLVVMTRGKEGSWVYDGITLYHQDILPVETIDSLGAGDAFAARFLVETARGVSIQAAMKLAAQSAAENCTHYGAYGYGQPY